MARAYTYTTDADPSIIATIEDDKGDVRAIPPSTNTTIASTDKGKHLIVNSSVTIPSNHGFIPGDAVTIYNNGSTTISINAGSGITLRFAGTSNTGGRSLGQYGLCSILCVGTNVFVIAGTGLT